MQNAENIKESPSPPTTPARRSWVDEGVARENMAEFKAQFVDLIERSAFIGVTANSLGLRESLVYQWMRDDPEFAENVRHAQSRRAEIIGLTAINKALEEKDTQLLIFLCKTLGKNLGFDEKYPAVNINVGNQADFDVSGLSLEEREQLLALVRKSKQQKESSEHVVQNLKPMLDMIDDGTRNAEIKEHDKESKIDAPKIHVGE